MCSNLISSFLLIILQSSFSIEQESTILAVSVSPLSSYSAICSTSITHHNRTISDTGKHTDSIQEININHSTSMASLSSLKFLTDSCDQAQRNKKEISPHTINTSLRSEKSLSQVSNIHENHCKELSSLLSSANDKQDLTEHECVSYSYSHHSYQTLLKTDQAQPSCSLISSFTSEEMKNICSEAVDDHQKPIDQPLSHSTEVIAQTNTISGTVQCE